MGFIWVIHKYRIVLTDYDFFFLEKWRILIEIKAPKHYLMRWVTANIYQVYFFWIELSV